MPERALGGLLVGVRRQIYLEEGDDRLLEERSRSTGLSVSELIRRAIREAYGSSRKLTWNEVFASPAQVGSAKGEPWIYDTLFDSDLDRIIDAELDSLAGAHESPSKPGGNE